MGALEGFSENLNALNSRFAAVLRERPCCRLGSPVPELTGQAGLWRGRGGCRPRVRPVLWGPRSSCG